jgi:hypothetical protein
VAHEPQPPDGELTWSGDPRLREHFANARRHDLGGAFVDEDGKPLSLIRKERPDSPLLIDLAMCSCLSWEARRDALALGAKRSSRALHAY